MGKINVETVNEVIKLGMSQLKEEEIMFVSAFTDELGQEYISFTLEVLEKIDLPEFNWDLWKQCEDIGKLLGKTTKEYLNILSRKIDKNFVYRELLLGEQRAILLKQIVYIYSELVRVLKYNKKSLSDEDIDIKPEHLAELMNAIKFPSPKA